MPALSPRLQALKDLLVEGDEVWDLCCDHGLLGEAALDSKLHPHVHFVDRVPEIVDKLRERLGSREKASFHAIDAGEIPQIVRGTVVIAGVGADRIRQIVGDLFRRDVLRAKRILVSPHTKIETVGEDFAATMGEWSVRRSSVKEGPRNRTIFVWDRKII